MHTQYLSVHALFQYFLGGSFLVSVLFKETLKKIFFYLFIYFFISSFCVFFQSKYFFFL